MSLVYPAGHNPLAARAPAQKRFEYALHRQSAKMGALCRAVKPWAGSFSDEIIKATIFHCGLYYLASLPEAGPRRSRAKLKADIRRATDLTERLAVRLRAVWNSRDQTTRHWLDPSLDAYVQGHDGLIFNSLDPGLVRALDELWRRLALLGQALPDDRGGPRKALAFRDLVDWLAGIYCTITSASTPPPRMFIPYVAAVRDLLAVTAPEFPRAHFDLPPSDEALRKVLQRVRDGHDPRLK
jgi:hypothetical protein